MGLGGLIGGGVGVEASRGRGDGEWWDRVGVGYTSLFYFYNFKAGFYKFLIVVDF